MSNTSENIAFAPQKVPSECWPAAGRGWLACCVGDPAKFLEQAWSKAPAVHHGQREMFAQLFSLDELSQLISMRAIPASLVTAVKNGRQIPSHLLAVPGHQGTGAALPADGVRIRELIKKGCTLRVSRIQQFAAGISRLCHGLESELSYAVNANLYFTPPSSQGLRTHYDDHDVIVLQTEGEKDWLIFEQYAEDPREPRHVTLPEGATPLMKITLRAGDSLYVPRGFVHCAAATGQPSLHISVGLHPATAAGRPGRRPRVRPH
jgi:bifunctional lysine-specific demethylase and histidyl-hydroxylase NO66